MHIWLSLVELHRCTKIKLDGQKTDHIHLVDCDPISASKWQRKESISSCWVSPDSHIRITERIQLALGRQQRDRCSLVLTADPKWGCITLPAGYHTCSSFLCVLPLWDIALWIRAQLVLELFHPNLSSSCPIISWCQVLYPSSACGRTYLWIRKHSSKKVASYCKSKRE